MSNLDLSLPRHQWKQFQCQGFDLWFWACLDCHQTLPIQEHPHEPEPPGGACLGKGPHNPEHIAILQRVCSRFGWAMPEHLREG